MGELLYRLKYRGDKSVLDDILNAVAAYLTNSWRIIQSLDLIVPIPPSNTDRLCQPVLELVRGVSSLAGIPFSEDALVKVQETPQLKNVYNYQERTKLLANAFRTKTSLVQGKTVLLLDDLYRSGATLNTASQALRRTGNVKRIYVLALTKTRSNT